MFLKCTGKWSSYDVYYYDVVNNLWIWKSGSTYYMSAIVGIPKWKDGAGTKYYPSGYIYNGYDYFIGYGGLYLWKDSATVYACGSILGVKQGTWYQEYEASSGNMRISGLPANPVAFTWTDAPVIARSSSTLLGVYTPVTGSGLTGNKYVGWRSHSYGTHAFVEQNILYNAKSIYLDSSTDARVCWWDSSVSRWVISAAAGTKDTLVGYWEKSSGAEPDGTYARTFTGEGTAPTPTSYVLAAPTYFEGTNTENMLMAQVALWL